MPLPPPPAAGLTSRGKPTAAGRGDQGVVRLRRVRRSRARTGTPSDAASRRAAALSPIDPDRLGRRPDPADPRSEHGLGEVGVLGQEPETGMERIGAGGHEPQRRRRGCRAGRARRRPRSRARPRGCRACRMSAVMRVAISPRLAMNSVRIGVVGRRRRPSRAVRQPPTRQSRHLRHANDLQRVSRAIDRSRSSAGRSAWLHRCVQQPGLGSVPRTSMSRSSHIGRRGVTRRDLTDRASRRGVASP